MKSAWRVMLGIAVLGFAVQRGAATFMLAKSGAPTLIWVGFLLQAIAAVFLWVAFTWVGRAIVPGLFLLAFAMIASALLGGFVYQVLPFGLALAQISVAAVGTLIFVHLMRRALADDER